MTETFTLPDSTTDLAAVAAEIGRTVAAAEAAETDAECRYPSATMAAVRSAGLLGALVPVVDGGPGRSVAEFARAVTALAEYCPSSAMILGMHGIQVALLYRHAPLAARERLAPDLLAGEMLIASATSEVGLYGDRRNSICALESRGPFLHLNKHASCVSYGEDSDCVLATARRTADSPSNEQVLAICLPPRLTLEVTGEWDTLGLRGTRSVPMQMTADVEPELVVEDYGDAFVRTGLPTSAILLSSVWLGISEGVAKRAHAAVRAQARKLRAADPSAAPPPSALRLAELSVTLHQARALIAYGASEYERVKDTPEVMNMGFSALMDSVKLGSSTLVGDIVRKAMGICGMGGFANAGGTSLSLLSRDAAAAPLMVNNDRALVAQSQALLLRKDL